MTKKSKAKAPSKGLIQGLKFLPVAKYKAKKPAIMNINNQRGFIKGEGKLMAQTIPIIKARVNLTKGYGAHLNINLISCLCQQL